MCLWTSLRVPFIMPKVIVPARISPGIAICMILHHCFTWPPHLIVHLHLYSSLYCPLVTHSSVHLSRSPRVLALSIASLVQSCLAKHVVRMGDPYCSPPLSICAFTSSHCGLLHCAHAVVWWIFDVLSEICKSKPLFLFVENLHFYFEVWSEPSLITGLSSRYLGEYRNFNRPNIGGRIPVDFFLES